MFQIICFYFTGLPGKMADISEKSIQNANLDNSLAVTELKVNSKKSNETVSDDVKEKAKLAFQRSKELLKAKKSAQKILQNAEYVSNEVKEITLELNGSRYLNLATDETANQFSSQNCQKMMTNLPNSVKMSVIDQFYDLGDDEKKTMKKE